MRLSIQGRSGVALTTIPVREFCMNSGIDISIIKAHSVRGASCPTAAGVGVTTKDILKLQRGHLPKQRAYCKKDDWTSFSTAVLSSKSFSNSKS